MRIAAQKVFRGDATVCEVASPAARDADFLGKFGGMIEQQYAPAALACGGCTHHAGGAGTDYNKVETLVSHNRARCVESGAEYAR